LATVVVASGARPGNPIEHRLLSCISINWAGVPLRRFDLAQRLIAGTTTAAGLTVTAHLKRRGHEQGEAVSDADMQRLPLTKHTTCPQWSYTLSPRPQTVAATPNRARGKLISCLALDCLKHGVCRAAVGQWPVGSFQA
jgi:hypothetical protein